MRKIYSLFGVAAFALCGAVQSYADTNFTVDPPAGVVSEFPSEFIVTYTDYPMGLALGSKENKGVTIMGPDSYHSTLNFSVVLVNGMMNTNQVKVTVADPPTVPGDYTVILDSGKLKDIGNGFKWLDCDNVTFKYKISSGELSDANVKISPEPGKVTEFPTSISITYNDETSLSVARGDNPVSTISGPGSFALNPAVSTKGNVLTLSMDKMPVTPGVYKVSVSSGELLGSGGDPLAYKNVEFEYNFDPAPMAPKMTISPTPGNIRRMPSEITVSFDDFQTVVPVASSNPCVTVTGPDDFNGKYFADNIAVNDLPSNKIKITVDNSTPFTGDGEYIFKIPVNALLFTPGARLSDIEFKYNLQEAPQADVLISPTAGTITEIPSEVKIKFNTIANLKLKINSNNYISVSGPENYLKTYKAEIDPSAPNTVFFNWTDGPTDNGAYTVSLDISGIEDASGTDPMDYTDISFTYIYRKVNKTVYNVTIDPAQGAVRQLPGEIKVSFNDLDMLTVSADTQPVTVAGPENYSGQLTAKGSPKPDHIITINWPEAPSVPGEYKVLLNTASIYDIEADAALDGEDIEIIYTLLPAATEAKITVDPAAGNIATFPSEIKITFENEELVVAGIGVTPKAEISVPEGSAISCPVTNTGYGNTLTINVGQAITAGGKYVVTLDPSQFVNEDGESLNYLPISITYTLTPSGVTLTADDMENADVYTVDGKILINKASSDDIRNLPAGVYVISGKKVLVK